MWWNTLIAVAVGAYGVVSSAHALLNKRDPRSTLGWVTLCLFLPAIGASLYWLIGNNRIRTRAREWHIHGRFELERKLATDEAESELATHHPEKAETMRALLATSSRVTGKPLLYGNKVEPLHNGEEAYPAMLEAIAGAERSIYLCTYIFDTDEAGLKFVDALAAAVERGVDVRVLVDAIGERYARPRVSRLLRRRGVRVARFLPLSPTLRGLRLNLRNHRKILVVDSKIGFTGGMNLGQRHMVTAANNRKPTADLHFRVTGPVAWVLEEVFWEDWHFSTGEEPNWSNLVIPEPTGEALCRGISDGPNEDLEQLQWIIVGALGCAHHRVQIVTPYFLPSRELLAALTGAALRGVEIDVILPEKNNQPLVAWACESMLPEVLQHGVRVYYQPPPFNHSKLMIIDDFYVLIGSANLDPRSLRLNFELNLEVFDPELAGQLSSEFDRVRGASHEVSIEELEALSMPRRLRDGVAKLMSPYL